MRANGAWLCSQKIIRPENWMCLSMPSVISVRPTETNHRYKAPMDSPNSYQMSPLGWLSQLRAQWKGKDRELVMSALNPKGQSLATEGRGQGRDTTLTGMAVNSLRPWREHTSLCFS